MKLKQTIFIVVGMVILSACVAPLAQVPTAQNVAQESVAEHSEHDHELHEHEVGLAEELGEVDFSVSCTPEAQAEFNHGMAFLHSFWFGPAIESFEHAAELDSTCAMAHWGMAMTRLGIPWSATREAALVAGWAAVEQAMEVGGQTPREQAYIDAVALLYKDVDALDFRTRTLAYEEAMAQLAQDYPDDTEAQIFYALALIITAPPTDKAYAAQQRAIGILAPIFAEQPNHPGVAHYLVHANDYPALAANGLDAARRFAATAPAAPHALHMPAHIFTRLGYWQESIETNRTSAQVAKADATETQQQNTGSRAWLHPMDYMMYAHLQLAQDEAAKALLDEIAALEKVEPEEFAAAYALAAMPARYVLERGQWADAVTLVLHPLAFSWDRFPGAAALLSFARGLGAARAGDVAAARQEIGRLEALRETMVATNDDYWVAQTDIQMEEITAWIALAEDKPDEALSAMRHAAELEAATEKHPVTPGPIVPASELLGEMLLELDQPAEALAAFEASQQVEPNRFRGLYGTARAAELSGETEKARGYYQQLLTLAETADSERAELTAARAFLAP